MVRDRANLKVDPDDLDRFNELRGGTKQIPFFHELLDNYKGVNGSEDQLTENQVREIVREEVRRALDDALSNY